MFTTLTGYAASNLTLAKMEWPSWEFAPGFVLLILLTLGVSRYLIEPRRKTRSYKNKQRDFRRKMSVPLIINTPVTQAFSVNTFDISLTGAFLSYDDLKNSMTFTSLVGKRTGIHVGDIVDITIYLGRFSRLHCQAKVIRFNFSDDFPNKGIGIEFLNLNARNKKLLEDVLAKDPESQVA